MIEECRSCAHMRPLPHDHHIRCIDPDPLMEGCEPESHPEWFNYPWSFEPIWKTRRCSHYTPTGEGGKTDA